MEETFLSWSKYLEPIFESYFEHILFGKGRYLDRIFKYNFDGDSVWSIACIGPVEF